MEERFCYGCMRMKQHSPVCEHCGYDERKLNQQHQLPIGTVLKQQYIVGRVLGQGGFGITYIGWDYLLKMPVAIKEYFPSSMVFRNLADGPDVEFCGKGEEAVFAKQKERFLKEARTLAQLTGIAQIVGVRNFFSENNTAYIVMEYVDGITLKDHLKKLGHPMRTGEALQTLEPVLLGLQAVHEKQLIHRDISPDNIMLLPDGSIKLIDFGTVRYLDESNRSKSTESILKPGFAPMEQYNSRGNLGPWTDVYALCATYYYCLTGKTPPDAPMRLDEGDQLPELKSVHGLTSGQRAALEKGLSLRVTERIQSLQELHNLLYSGAAPAQKGKKKSGWKKSILLPVVAAVAAVAAALALTVSKNNTPPIPEETAVYTPQSQETTLPVYSHSAWLPTEDTTEHTLPEPSLDRERWEGNVLKAQDFSSNSSFLGIQGINRYQVTAVTFLDSTAQISTYSYDVSADGSGRVRAYVDGTKVFIAADGGINGAQSCKGLFEDCGSLEAINFNGCFYTDDATDFSNMFAECRQLTEVDLSGFRTHNAVNMNSMFLNCTNLVSLDVSSFDTAKVTDMGSMFDTCDSLEQLDVGGFRTENVTNMRFMFNGCEALQSLTVGGFNTGKVTDMTGMFQRVSQVDYLNVSGFDTSSVTSMEAMFHNCLSLAYLDVSGFDTGNVADMDYMFCGCSQLTELDVSGFQTENVTSMKRMFQYLEKVPFLDLRQWNTARVTDMSYMLDGCKGLEMLYLGPWETGAVTQYDGFYHNEKLPNQDSPWKAMFS